MSRLVRIHLPEGVGDGFVTLRANEDTTTAAFKQSLLRTIRKKRPSLLNGISSFFLEKQDAGFSGPIESEKLLDQNTTDLYLRQRIAHLVRVTLPADLGGGFVTLSVAPDTSAGPFLRQVLSLVNKKRGLQLREYNYSLTEPGRGVLTPDRIVHEAGKELHLKLILSDDEDDEEEDVGVESKDERQNDFRLLSVTDPSHDLVNPSRTGFMQWVSSDVGSSPRQFQPWYFVLSGRMLSSWPTRGDAMAHKLPTCHLLTAVFRSGCRLLVLVGADIGHLCAGEIEQAIIWELAFRQVGVFVGLGILGLQGVGSCAHGTSSDDIRKIAEDESGRVLDMQPNSSELHALARCLSPSLRSLHLRNGQSSLGYNTLDLGELFAALPGSKVGRLEMTGFVMWPELLQQLRALLRVTSPLHSVALHFGAPPKTEGFDAASNLVQSLSTSRLRCVDLSDTPLGCIVHLPSLLHVSDLRLRNCMLSGVGALQGLGEALAVNTRLTGLDLSANALQDRDLQGVFRALRHNRTLTRLHVRDNNLTSLTEITHVLQINFTLRDLNLANNRFVVMSKFARVLRDNSTLQVLDLSDCNVTQRNLLTLCKALVVNKGLQSLSVASNHFQLSGTKALLDAVGLHPSLRYLDISDNKIEEDGGAFLVAFMERSQRLTTLRAEDNRFSKRVLLQLEDLGNANQALLDGVRVDPRVLHFPVLSLHAHVRIVRAVTLHNVHSALVAFSVLTNSPETTAMSPSCGYLAPRAKATIHVLVTGGLDSVEAASHLLVIRIALVNHYEVNGLCPEDFWKRQLHSRAYRSVFIRCIGVSSLKEVPFLSQLGQHTPSNTVLQTPINTGTSVETKE